jgi:hypothetical protein
MANEMPPKADHPRPKRGAAVIRRSGHVGRARGGCGCPPPRPSPRAGFIPLVRGDWDWALVVIGRPRGRRFWIWRGRDRPAVAAVRGLAVTHRGVGDVTGQIWASSTSFEAHQDLRGVVPQSRLGLQGVLGRGAWRGRCGGLCFL